MGPVGPPGFSSTQPGANGPTVAGAPHPKHLIRSWHVPMRRHACVKLYFNPEDQNVLLMVFDAGTLTPIAKYAGLQLEYPCGSSGWRPAGAEDGTWAVRNLGDAQIVALSALKASGDFCGNQARADFERVGRLPLWDDVVDGVKGGLAAAAVMMT